MEEKKNREGKGGKCLEMENRGLWSWKEEQRSKKRKIYREEFFCGGEEKRRRKRKKGKGIHIFWMRRKKRKIFCE